MILALTTISLTASDVTSQRRVALPRVPVEMSIAELLHDLAPRLKLDRFDRDGNPLQVEVRHDREGRNLHASEKVGDALTTNDHLVLHPRVMAG